MTFVNKLYNIFDFFWRFFLRFFKELKIKLHESNKQHSKEQAKKHRFALVGKGWGKGFVKDAVLTKNMFLPYFWPSWLGMGIYALMIIVLPYRVQLCLGRLLGKLFYRLLKSRVYVAERNLKLAFPSMSPEERQSLVKRIMENSGIAIFETGMAWLWSDRRLLKRAVIDPEELKAAQQLAAENHPTIVLTCHFMTLEIMARLYALLIKPGIGVYHPSDHPVLEYTQVKGRLRSNLALVNNKDPRSMLRAMLQKVPIWYAPDQDYGPKVSIFAPFFGVEKAATVTGTHDLARVADTIVQPSWTIREHGKYRLRVLPPLKDFPGPDALADTIRCNRILEKMIESAPDQYLWVHRRFKTVPEGETTRYPKLSDKPRIKRTLKNKKSTQK